MAINRGIHDKLSTLKALYPIVADGDYAEIIEEQMTYVFSKGGWNPGTPAAAPGVANSHELTSIAILPGTGIKIGAIISFRLFRQNGGTDTFTGNAFLHSIGIHYQKDTVGSRGITTK